MTIKLSSPYALKWVAILSLQHGRLPLKSVLLLGIVLSNIFFTQAQLVSHTEMVKLMGSRFEITAVAANDSLSMLGVKAGIREIQRIEKLISSWDSLSQTHAINQAAGIKAVRVEKELLSLIVRANKVSKLTAGAFDISYAALDRIWKFDGTMTQLPSAEAINQSVRFINYRSIEVDTLAQTVFLPKAGMKIGFGAIGKGYAANRARRVMQQMGIDSGLVNAGGDLIAWGQQSNGEPWRIAIADPNQPKNVNSWLVVNNQAVVTSGDYERYAEISGVRYAHIIDPRTGYPVQGLKSVTIVSPDAELSDALATAVFVMGAEDGLTLVNKLKGVECLMITAENKMITSDNLKLNYYGKQ